MFAEVCSDSRGGQLRTYNILLTAEAGRGVFTHVLKEHESWLVKIADGCADADKNIQAMIQSTPDLNLQHKRNTELMRVEEMILAVASLSTNTGVSMFAD